MEQPSERLDNGDTGTMKLFGDNMHLAQYYCNEENLSLL